MLWIGKALDRAQPRASPEVHRVSEWRHRCVSRLRFPRSLGPALALAKDAPDHRPVETPEMGEVVSLPRLGGLHHRYSRRAA